MKRLLTLLLFLITNYGFSQIQFFVATTGNDLTGTGTITSPFKTLEKAKQAVRAYKANSGMATNINVWIRAGEYFLTSSLKFKTEDSGINGYNVIYSSYNGEKVKISGGVKVPSNLWQVDPLNSSIYRANLSSLLTNGFSDFRQLYINENVGIRAKHQLPANLVTTKLNSNTYQITPSLTIVPTNQSQIELIANWKWFSDRLKVQSISGQNIVVDPLFGVSDPFNELFSLKWLENAYEFIDSGMEWYFNKSTKYVYLKPPAGINVSNLKVIIPRLDTLIYADNVDNLIFENLEFSEASWTVPNLIGHHVKQASVYQTSPGHWSNLIPGNLLFRNSRNVKINGCIIKNCGGDGLAFEDNCKNVILENNEIYQVAGSGIRFGDNMNELDQDQREVFDSKIINNKIHNVANEYFSSVGIFLMLGKNIEISNNELYNLPYSGISHGFAWFPSSVTYLGGNSISNNKIYNVLTTLSDGGAIYSLGVNSPRSYITNNFIYNIPDHSTQPNGPRAAIYLDQASANLTVENNYGEQFQYFVDTKTNTHVFNNTGICKSNIVDSNKFGCNSFWIRSLSYDSPVPFADCCLKDLGVRFVDVNGDSLRDIIMHRWSSASNQQVKAFLNTGTGWQRDDSYAPPYHISSDAGGDMGVLFVDLDGDGLEDMIYNRKNYATQKGAYKNTGSGWQSYPSFTPPVSLYDDTYGELGIRLVDVDHNGLKDLVYYRWISASVQERGVYLNNGTTWVMAPGNTYLLPYHINSSSAKDLGVRFVDLNGDGYEDMVYNREAYNQQGAYINSGTGWVYNSNYIPPVPISSDAIGDLGVRFIDVNKDGLKDFIVNREISSTNIQKQVYLNQSGKWLAASECFYFPPFPFQKNGSNDLGVRIVDLNGDGSDDIVNSLWSNSTVVSEAYFNDSWTYKCTPSQQGNMRINLEQVNESKTTLLSEVNLFPNPTSGELNFVIKDKKFGKSPISISNAGGMILKNGYTTEDSSFNISDLPSGLYLIQILYEGKYNRFKVIKE